MTKQKSKQKLAVLIIAIILFIPIVYINIKYNISFLDMIILSVSITWLDAAIEVLHER
jgi:hypothetical protein